MYCELLKVAKDVLIDLPSIRALWSWAHTQPICLSIVIPGMSPIAAESHDSLILALHVVSLDLSHRQRNAVVLVIHGEDTDDDGIIDGKHGGNIVNKRVRDLGYMNKPHTMLAEIDKRAVRPDVDDAPLHLRVRPQRAAPRAGDARRARGEGREEGGGGTRHGSAERGVFEGRAEAGGYERRRGISRAARGGVGTGGVCYKSGSCVCTGACFTKSALLR